VRLQIARVKYRLAATVTAGAAADAGAGEPLLVTAPVAPHILPRSLGTPSLFAHILNEKFCYGMPFHRQADRFAHLGLALDRGLMCRWAEHLGGTVGATVVHAMHADAMRTAFCIATDATGILVQPIAGGDRARRACTRAHFLVQIADRDHVFFEFLARETSATIGALFRGFAGYVQADAKSVYNLLYLPPDQRPPPDDDAAPDLAERAEVGCWSHLRRKFWEAAVTTHDPVAREACLRIKRVFDLDRTRKKSWPGRRQPPDAHRVGAAPCPRLGGLPPRPVPRPAALAPGPLPRTCPQVLARHPRPPGPCPAQG
jgi:transposase